MRYSRPRRANTAVPPHAGFPGYVPESDLEEDDKDPEEDPADYPANRDDDDDDDEDEDEEEEEEHPALTDSVPPVHPMTARISIRDEPSISLPPREEIERLLALTTPPPSPLTPLSSPLPQITLSPLPIPSHHPIAPNHIEIPESCLPLRKRVRFASPTPSHEVGESSAAGAARQDIPAIARDDPYSIAREDLYGFVDMVDVPPRCSMSRELDYGITDAWDDLETSFMYDASDYARSDVMSLHTMVVAQSALISELQSADHRRQGVIKELWASDHKRQLCYAACIIYLVQHTKCYGYIPASMALENGTKEKDHEVKPRCNTNTSHRHSSLTLSPITQIQAMINEGVTAALAARDATRNGDDSHTSGTGARRPVQVARECTYPDFLKCQPLNFKGTEGVVGLTQWFEKMESVYSISNCTVACQVKFATCTLQGNALTWWNSHVKTTTPEAAHAMPWKTLKKDDDRKILPKG
ncbi:hypothetical protein Tco_0237995 [Tanacetum coccineum]